MLNVYEFIAAFEAVFCKCYFDGAIRDQGRSETEVQKFIQGSELLVEGWRDVSAIKGWAYNQKY